MTMESYRVDGVASCDMRYKYLHQLLVRFSIKPPHVAFVDNTVFTHIKSIDHDSFRALISEIEHAIALPDDTFPAEWCAKLSYIEFYDATWARDFLKCILDVLNEIGQKHFK